MEDDVIVQLVPISPSGTGFSGGYNFTVAKPNFSSALNASGASYNSNDNEVTWLKWLLEDGAEPVVENYHIFISDKIQKGSRAGYALMKMGGEWNVPEDFSGTKENNWFTRALANFNVEIEDITRKALQNASN